MRRWQGGTITSVPIVSLIKTILEAGEYINFFLLDFLSRSLEDISKIDLFSFHSAE